MGEPGSPLVLASASAARRRLLTAAGLDFEVEPAIVDEEGLKELFSDSTRPENAAYIASLLAETKARQISERRREAVVIGADQVLSIKGRVLSKPASTAEALAHLRLLSGQTHELVSAVALAERGEVTWSGVGRARLTMRPLSEAFMAAYLERAGERVRASVGAYEIEGLGVHLFETVEGDHFTIQGLPMLELLRELRRRGVIIG